MQEETASPAVTPEKVVKRHRWAIKAQLGTALPADDGTYKMPISAGVTVERKLNDYLGIETGLLYSNLRSAGQHLHYLGIILHHSRKEVKIFFSFSDAFAFYSISVDNLTFFFLAEYSEL